MQRAPARIVLRLLHRSGYDVTASALRQWVRRGHITRAGRGYSLEEILSYLDARDARDGDQTLVS